MNNMKKLFKSLLLSLSLFIPGLLSAQTYFLGVNGSNAAFATRATSDLSDWVTWTDYSSTSTVTGWSSFTTKDIRYTVHGKTIYILWLIQGTSNATTASFTFPYTAVNSANFYGFNTGIASDNGGAFVGCQNYVNINTATVSLGKDFTTYTWTNTGTKKSEGLIIIPIQ